MAQNLYNVENNTKDNSLKKFFLRMKHDGIYCVYIYRRLAEKAGETRKPIAITGLLDNPYPIKIKKTKHNNILEFNC
jgi:hypothetical protein